MASKKPILEKMKSNPKGWKINDIEKVCNQEGLIIKPPSRGSHYKVLSNLLQGSITVPFKRPIKPVYIKEFVSFAEAHIEVREAREKEG
ncbi:type II toxin-antitoxin system HicA family toxin [Denitrobaculum tricleocarpae]|uniref:Type II toxin-antitoxin system HicA family toxin n=1 Tax=Denitrobaculum tricleocarpae TaxID=2591009 RepID=A0A545TSZ7_9PROT|nr:type II toxin-antitoxin system HicA family toxin [Denitrobaculum tricleocarpae]TQV80349.1 type II toxin-antitoxin system HicA family toxin [Denitrobaculum tricleocarpae]